MSSAGGLIMRTVAHVARRFADLVAHLARGVAHPLAHLVARLARAAAHGIRHQAADLLAQLREPVADIAGNRFFDLGDRTLDLAKSLADAAFHVAGNFAHNCAGHPAALGNELAGGVEHATHKGGNLAAKLVGKTLERGRECAAHARAIAAAGEIALARVGARDDHVGAAGLDRNFQARTRGRVGTDRTVNMTAAEPLKPRGVDAVGADSAPSRGGVELERSIRVHFHVDPSAASNAPRFIGRKGTGEIDRAAHIFKIERAADAADTRAAADKAHCDFAGDTVGRELAAYFADPDCAGQVRGAHFAPDDANFDVGGVFDFEMSTDDAGDERPVQAKQPRGAGDFFDRHFAVDGAAIEFADDQAEGDRVGGFNRERAADFEAFNRTGFPDRDVAANGVANGDGAEAARVEIAANALDNERGGEIGDVEVAGKIF